MKKPETFWQRLSRTLCGRSVVKTSVRRQVRPRLERLEPRLTPSGIDPSTALMPNAYGGATSGNLQSRNQVDLYIISGLQAGDELKADLGASNGAGQPGDALRLFDANGKQLAFQENPGKSPNTPTLTFDATAAETYYVGVSSDGDYGYDPSQLSDRK